MHLQETVAVRKKIKDLLLRIAELETIFRAHADDVKEQTRRNELLRYVIVPPPFRIGLISFQQAQGRRGGIAVVL